MIFMTLEDLTGTMDVIVFPDVYRQARSILDLSSPTLVVGVMEMDSNRTEPISTSREDNASNVKVN